VEARITRHRLQGQKLREYSLITWFFERIFWLLHQLSPARLVRRSRDAHVSSPSFRADPHASTVRRSRRVEAYIIAWLAIEMALVTAIAVQAAWPSWITRALAITRLLDIFQQSVNMSVFDQLRSDERLVISSAVRTLVLSFLNYLELIVCFAVLYATWPGTLIGSTSWLDDLYFSIVTQLTIGYGDIRPVGPARFVSNAQGLVSVIFTILMLGRIVSVLPKIDTVMKHSPNE
jgi:hypothetical protein